MKFSSLIALSVASTAPCVLAQYQWKSLSLSGQTPIDYLFVRPHAGGTVPVTDVTSLNLRCNAKGSTSSAAATLTVTVNSANRVQQLVWTPNTPFTEPGAWTIYLARVPANSTASTFDGSGQVWFKIAQGTYRIKTSSTLPTIVPLDSSVPGPTYIPLDSPIPSPTPTLTPAPLRTISATVPKDLPAADYLVRAEFIDLTKASAVGGAQFFVSCGQISVVGGGTGIPRLLVAIPGAYKDTDPGILYDISDPPLSYKFPGPAVWPPIYVLDDE
ncbi:hypothetical protein FRC02_000920 [Tulasnella sp. 418]|nr:hypothetical protein FRC02_000920 [Tulasnella sp. 418]